MTVLELIDVLLDLDALGHGDCPVKVTTPHHLVELDADAITVCDDDTPAYVRLDVP